MRPVYVLIISWVSDRTFIACCAKSSGSVRVTYYVNVIIHIYEGFYCSTSNVIKQQST